MNDLGDGVDEPANLNGHVRHLRLRTYSFSGPLSLTRRDASSLLISLSELVRRIQSMDRALVLSSVCRLIAEHSIDSAKETLLRDYPRYGVSTTRTAWPIRRLVELYVRDGFTDRYFGNRLVFPGTLRALSVLLGDSFPYHRNWKQSSTHPGFYELYPTIDHVVPVARGGPDDESNVVTTSMLHNSAKANWFIEELNWPAERAPVVTGWDGLLGWFMTAWNANEVLRRDQALCSWQRAARCSDGF